MQRTVTNIFETANTPVVNSLVVVVILVVAAAVTK
jgi:hypothetical protein